MFGEKLLVEIVLVLAVSTSVFFKVKEDVKYFDDLSLKLKVKIL